MEISNPTCCSSSSSVQSRAVAQDDGDAMVGWLLRDSDNHLSAIGLQISLCCVTNGRQSYGGTPRHPLLVQWAGCTGS